MVIGEFDLKKWCIHSLLMYKNKKEFQSIVNFLSKHIFGEYFQQQMSSESIFLYCQ